MPGKNSSLLDVVVLISGNGSNLQALIDASRRPGCRYRIAAVISNRADAHGLKRAAAAGIAQHCLLHTEFAARADFERALQLQIDSYSPGLVVLAGFMRILTPEFVEHYQGRLLNIHPSLLPQYRGLRTHERVLEAGERMHGASVHFVTAELDGGPVILQSRVPVLPGDSAETLAARVHTQEHIIYPLVVEWYAKGRLRMRDERILFDHSDLTLPLVHQELTDETISGVV
ncbi:MAG TPA: phosphoribosylglycinamide formyltransferase [Gammaproteobacteria bacterium]|nr:phosphoribosylglycinamide formyltransferase [Gammaproteobacteria bacterium]